MPGGPVSVSAVLPRLGYGSFKVIFSCRMPCIAAKNASSRACLPRHSAACGRAAQNPCPVWARGRLSKNLLGGSEGRSPPKGIPNPATCAVDSEALPSKVSLHVSPAAPKAQGKRVLAEKAAAGGLFRQADPCPVWDRGQLLDRFAPLPSRPFRASGDKGGFFAFRVPNCARWSKALPAGRACLRCARPRPAGGRLPGRPAQRAPRPGRRPP